MTDYSRHLAVSCLRNPSFSNAFNMLKRRSSTRISSSRRKAPATRRCLEALRWLKASWTELAPVIPYFKEKRDTHEVRRVLRSLEAAESQLSCS